MKDSTKYIWGWGMRGAIVIEVHCMCHLNSYMKFNLAIPKKKVESLKKHVSCKRIHLIEGTKVKNTIKIVIFFKTTNRTKIMLHL